MGKRLDWAKNNRNAYVKATRKVEQLYRVDEDVHNMQVQEFFAHVRYYKSRGLPVPEFKIDNDH